MTLDFDNLIHQLMNAPRPKVGREGNIKALVSKLVDSIGETLCDKQNVMWKRMILSLLYKRYHALSPEGKSASSNSTAGDGERLIFYTAITTLLEHQTTPDTTKKDPVHQKNICKALQLLCQLSPHVGGSRDVCKLMEVFVARLLEQQRQSNVLLEQVSSDSMKIAQAVDLIETHLQASSDMGPFSALRWLLDFSGRQLTSDLDTIQNVAIEPRDPPSTLHVFIPHNQRGLSFIMSSAGVRRSNNMRHLVNCSLEILIWSRSQAATKNRSFSKALATFRETANHGADDHNKKDAVKSALMTIQTIIRKFRQKLNRHARDNGYMLTDLYRLDPSKLTLRQIQHGKCGDLSMLTRLATKERSRGVLKMIQLRFASNPKKITKYASVLDMARSFGETKEDTAANEINALQRAIQVSRLAATIQYMRDTFARNTVNKHHGLVIASIDRSSLAVGNLNHMAGMLVAAAMQSWPLDLTAEPTQANEFDTVKLVLGKSQQHIGSFQEFVGVLDSLLRGDLKVDHDVETFVGGEGTDDAVATSKTVMNVIDRHVVGPGGGDEPKANFLVFTCAGVRLPLHVQTAFVSAGYRMHCHDSDDIGSRLQRKKCRSGDITISLAWDTFDDLDLHVVLPSNEEIAYWNKNSIDGRACLDVDMNAGGRDSEEPVENVSLGDAEERIEAIHGTYKVFVRNFAYHTRDKDAAIQWRVVIDMNGLKQRFMGQCRGEGSASDVIVCEFDYKGRTVPFPGDEKETFETSNLVNLTSSTGQTLESLAQLLTTMGDLEALDDVQALAIDDADATGMQVEETPTEAGEGSLLVTSRNLLDIKLSKLPRRFHFVVSEAFGGISFAEECAEVLARQMVKDRIPLNVLSNAGYPPDVVDAVKSKLVSAVGAFSE